MKSFASRITIPVAGVSLGFAALGNLLRADSAIAANVCGVVSALLFLLVVLRVLFDRKGVVKEFQNPVTSSVAGTAPMALMLLAGYIAPVVPAVAFALWIVGVCLHLALIVWFTIHFFGSNFDLSKVFASYYIVYVGIVVASVSAPVYGMQALGNVFFWFGLVSLAALLVVVTLRYVKLPDLPQPAQPLFCIYAAPTSLCVAGYIQSGQPKNLSFALALLGLSYVIYVVALVRVPKILCAGFFPSHAALTFPFVISAIASRQVCAMAMKAGAANVAVIVKPISYVQEAICVVLCVFVLVEFLGMIFQHEHAKAAAQKA